MRSAPELAPDMEAVLCRERQEKAANKARAAAEAHWRNLLRSIFTRLHVQGQYATADAAVTPEIGRAPAPAQREQRPALEAAALVCQLVWAPRQACAWPCQTLCQQGGAAAAEMLWQTCNMKGCNSLADEVVSMDSEEEQEKEKPARKSGAAAAAAIAAAKEGAAALKLRKATWKDPVVAAREAAARQRSAASDRDAQGHEAALQQSVPALASTQDSAPGQGRSGAQAGAGTGAGPEQAECVEASEPAPKAGRARTRQAGGQQRAAQRPRRTAQQDRGKGTEEGAGAGRSRKEKQPRRIRNGVTVECEEI